MCSFHALQRLYYLANIAFHASHQALLSGFGLSSVTGSNYRTPNSGFCLRKRNCSCSSFASLRSNSHLADSILLALSQAIA
jgi:hypothetical protein